MKGGSCSEAAGGLGNKTVGPLCLNCFWMYAVHLLMESGARNRKFIEHTKGELINSEWLESSSGKQGTEEKRHCAIRSDFVFC